MRKIISLFHRNHDGDRLAYDQITPGAEWVPAGEGIATRKFDGTCCLIEEGRLFRRYSCRERTRLPEAFQIEERVEQKDLRGNEVVKLYGWIPVGDGPEDRRHREALVYALETNGKVPDDGTYELVGPKIQGNPEHFCRHTLVRHGAEEIPDAPRTFDALREWFFGRDIEGIVWHHPDGWMVKIKKRDFGLIRSS